MILYLVKYSLNGHGKASHLKEEHLRYLSDLYHEGPLLAAGLFKDQPGGGYLLFQTTSYDQTREYIEKDPYIQHGVRDYEIHTWDTSPFPLRT